MTEQHTPPVVLVDGSSYLFRAYHALPPLMTSKNHPTGAIKGVIAMIRRIDLDFPGSKIVVVFDAKGKTFRNDLYADYKANRPPMPEDLAVQIEPIHQIVRHMGLPLLIVDGVEADDVIGTLAHEATSKGIDVVVSTGDKDMAQLVSAHVTLINTMTNTHMDAAGVEEKFGVTPAQIIDYLALMGDKVDNIPGVNKCGPKTAVKWLQEYQNIDNLMANADDIKGKVGEYLRDARETLPLSRILATIKLDVELAFGLEDLQEREQNNSALLELFREYELRSWINELENSGPQTAGPAAAQSGVDQSTSDQSTSDNSTAHQSSPGEPTQPRDKHYSIITDQAELDEWIERLKAAELFAFDTETTSLKYMAAEVVGVSFAVQPFEAAYVPFCHDYMGAPEQLDRDTVLAQLKPLLESPDHKKVGQNLKYDKNVLANHDICLEGIAEDTMVQSYVLNSVSSRHNMDALALHYLGEETTTFESLAGKGAKQLTFNQLELDKAGPYAAEDADITLRLHQALRPQLAATGKLQSVYEDIDLPLVPVLSRMEQRGTLISASTLRQHSQELAERMAELETAAYEAAGETFNLGSPKQLQVIFYEKLGLPVLKKTPKGTPSTAEPVLQELAHSHELPRLLLEHRSLSKLKSTYTDTLPELIHHRTGRVHTSYHQAVTATGRLSSSEPNLQNIPIRSEQGRRIRQAFIAEKGYKLLAADYSQIELRIMAHLSKDKGLLTAFAKGEDIHKATAAEVFGVTLEEVNTDQRRSAKAINFGLIYGMSAFGLARQLDVERKVAQQYIDRYFERYPGVLTYMDNIRKQAHEDGYVETLFGRRLYLPEINARNKQLQQAAERTAINAPMQGTAADIIKFAMIEVERWLLAEYRDSARMTMQVHDELIIEVKEDAVEAVREGLIRRMSGAAKLAVPLLVEAGVGDNWDQAH
ncbi:MULTISPECIES: DNA polymerase I [unclassified Marinobacter]|uniref:DNA polymerase I n=1 Tax=unclassified Marinobacter TaxID=83889 RepID=UPI00200F2A9D|nr:MULTISPECIES: DNA polymerase I [unclassified Marinobacter]MCL1476527.1 DNA polymerase I [Marinobacter sp.]MCL1483682.1 DNA polymerase I [Marinobacter sp.]MCL1486573.1 DNA polymerase I [Marinobacter sp.]UQG56669.1 DNA polymerase I [Marinobacter sp. M4C]UQG65473.1 DNA polymerase I [Marinobacter sp. M2C]